MTRKIFKHLDLSSTILSNIWLKEDASKEIIKYLTGEKLKYSISKCMGCKQSSASKNI